MLGNQFVECGEQTEVRSVGAHNEGCFAAGGVTFRHINGNLANIRLGMRLHAQKPRWICRVGRPEEVAGPGDSGEIRAFAGAHCEFYNHAVERAIRIG
jgi:hypothetical protein